MVPRNCESWEEEMYWKNFGFARFSLILPCDFHHRLMLPKKFTEHMRNQLPDKVVLKVNSLTWNMDLEKGKDDVVLHGNEWQEFAKAYSLKKSDMLIFQYNRHECFEVLLFDHANQCEKEASYFVKKGQHVQPNSHDSEEEFTDRNQGSRRRRNSSAAATGCFSDGNVSDEGGETSDEENSISADGFTTPKKASTKRAKELPSNFSNKRNYKLAATPKEKRARLVTNEEKKVALEKARKTSTLCLNSFFVVMRPTCVYKRFYMTIPQESRSMFCRGQKLILRVKEKAWVCTFTSSRHTGGLEGGWKRFALENSLEEYDVCLFAPSGAKDGRSVLDVSIFRVVPQVVQHSRPAIPDDETNEISIEDSSQGDDDSDFDSDSDTAQRKRHIKNSGGNAHTRGVDLSDEDESDESSDEETSSTTPEEAATLRSREVPSNSSKKRKHRIAAATTPKENGTYRKPSAGRTSIKEANKEQVLKMAHETADKYKNSFISVMKPSSVTKCYFMSITKEWKFRDTLMNGQEVILRLKKDKEKTWTCIFCSTSSNVGLQTGWKNFAIDNKLRESDVCLFVPVQENNRISKLDVLILRVQAEH